MVEAFKQSETFIDCRGVDQAEISNLKSAVIGLSPDLTNSMITSTHPPDLVLNRLETLGYKVVGTNTVKDVLIRTLQKQA